MARARLRTEMNRRSVLGAIVMTVLAPASAAAQPSGPVVLLVNPKSGVKTLAEFVAWGRRSGRPLTYASSGLNSDGHRLAATFERKLGIEVVHVPYRTAAQGLLDLLGGHIDFAAVNAIAAVGQIRGGLLTAVAVAAKARMPEFPEVPTFAESGYADFAGAGHKTVVSWRPRGRMVEWLAGTRG